MQIFDFDESKKLFDFIRNVLIAFGIVAASFMVERSIFLGDEQAIMYSDTFFRDRQALGVTYEELLKNSIQSQLNMYLKGFKEGGVRTFEAPNPEVFYAAKHALAHVEALRIIRLRESSLRATIANVSLLLGVIFLLYNCISFVRYCALKFSGAIPRIVAFFLGGLAIFGITGVSAYFAINFSVAQLYSQNAISENDIQEFVNENGRSEEYDAGLGNLDRGPFEKIKWPLPHDNYVFGNDYYEAVQMGRQRAE